MQSIINMWVLILLTTAILVASNPIESFGLLTVTHSRNGDFQVLNKYLKRYTETQCYTQFISEINIVWNNEEAPEITSVLTRKQFWKIPVYFFITTFNSMDHRYRLPRNSTAQLLYSLDDDIIVDCDTFRQTLAKYNQVNKQQLGSIATNEVRGFAFDPNNGVQFFYQGHPTSLFYSIAQPGAAFIPRHYLELYYLKLNELIYMRKIVLDVKNCDDIFFWAIVQHFYPQLPAIYVKAQKDYRNTDPKVGQSKVKDVYSIRSKCIMNISDALGYNSLRLYSKNSTKYLSNWQYPNLDVILNQKIVGLAGVATVDPPEKPRENAPQTQIPVQQLVKKMQPPKPRTKQEIKKDKEKKEALDKIRKEQKPVVEPRQQAEASKYKKQASAQQTNKGETKMQQNLPKTNTANKETLQTSPAYLPKTESNNQKQKQQINERSEKDKAAAIATVNKTQENLGLLQYLNFSFGFREKMAILVAITIILICALYKSYRKHQIAAQIYSQRLEDIDEEQVNYASSIRLPDHY